jgi:hypothetical protein
MSHGLGHGLVVPLGEDLVEDDFHCLLESHGTFAACLVHLMEDAHSDRQTRGGFGLGDVVPHCLQRLEDHPATRPRHMREKAVLNWIVLRAVGRVVGHADLDAQPVCQLLTILPSLMLPSEPIA